MINFRAAFADELIKLASIPAVFTGYKRDPRKHGRKGAGEVDAYDRGDTYAKELGHNIIHGKDDHGLKDHFFWDDEKDTHGNVLSPDKLRSVHASLTKKDPSSSAAKHIARLQAHKDVNFVRLEL